MFSLLIPLDATELAKPYAHIMEYEKDFKNPGYRLARGLHAAAMQQVGVPILDNA